MIERVAVRLAKPSECALLSDLAFRSKAYWGYSTDFMEACREELRIEALDLQSSDQCVWLAEHEDAILGYYALKYLSRDDVELDALFVEPEYIGNGVGKTLIEHAKVQAQANGRSRIIVQGDPHATAFYLAAGGVQIGERESESVSGRMLPEFAISLLGDR